jgi:quinolinate synthase
LARHVAQHVPEKTIIAWDGYCYVHHQITPETIVDDASTQIPGIKILVHPECRDDVVETGGCGAVDFGDGGVRRSRADAKEFLAVTECGLSDLLQIQVPEKTFYRACKICRFMKAISLEDVEAGASNKSASRLQLTRRRA